METFLDVIQQRLDWGNYSWNELYEECCIAASAEPTSQWARRLFQRAMWRLLKQKRIVRYPIELPRRGKYLYG